MRENLKPLRTAMIVNSVVREKGRASLGPMKNRPTRGVSWHALALKV
jgi:hypothetical protein